MKFSALFLLAFAAAAHAELKWEATSHHFVYAPGKRVMKHEFAYTNAGRTTVRVTGIKSGCACCTAAHATIKVVAPGVTGKIVMRVDVGGRDIPLAKPVIVTTDDGMSTPLVIHVDTADGKPVKVPRWGK